MVKYETIVLKKTEEIVTLVFNRPEKLNAMNEQMFEETIDALRKVASDDSIRVLVITGAGRAFCVGADVAITAGAKTTQPANAESLRQRLRSSAQQVSKKIYNLQIPTIAMVNGEAVGGGLDWAMACDIRVGSEKARFMVGFTRIGLFPGTGGTWLMTRLMGAAKAAELLFTGDFLEAKEAERIGVLNKLVPADELEKVTFDLARRIAAGPPIAIKISKLQLRKAFEMDFDFALEVAAACETITLTSEDHREGVKAFREKRPPRFIGR